MSCYFVSQIQIEDLMEYQKYLDAVDEVFEKFKGKYLSVDTDPEILEGNWSYDRVVIIQFSNEEELRRWYDSPEYQSIVQYRLRGARCDTLIVKGLST